MRKKDPPDWEAMQTGSIPWAVEECFAVMMHENHLIETHPDDWDRTRRGLSIKGDDGQVSRLVFNPNVRINQMAFYMMERYKDLEDSEKMSHIFRYMAIKGFVCDHEEELRSDGLLRESEDNDEMQELSEALIEVLATSPYTKAVPIEEEGGTQYWEFDYDEIAIQAMKLMAKEDGDEE